MERTDALVEGFPKELPAALREAKKLAKELDGGGVIECGVQHLPVIDDCSYRAVRVGMVYEAICLASGTAFIAQVNRAVNDELPRHLRRLLGAPFGAGKATMQFAASRDAANLRAALLVDSTSID